MVQNESENDTKEVHTDDSDEKTENTELKILKTTIFGGFWLRFGGFQLQI